MDLKILGILRKELESLQRSISQGVTDFDYMDIRNTMRKVYGLYVRAEAPLDLNLMEKLRIYMKYLQMGGIKEEAKARKEVGNSLINALDDVKKWEEYEEIALRDKQEENKQVKKKKKK